MEQKWERQRRGGASASELADFDHSLVPFQRVRVWIVSERASERTCEARQRAKGWVQRQQRMNLRSLLLTFPRTVMKQLQI
eukprot:2976828-Rhodomonas_salina.1